MSGTNYIVGARSWDDIAVITDDIRKQLGISDRADFPIMTTLEKVFDAEGITELRIGDKADMGNVEGYTCLLGEYIELREDVYQKAWEGEGRARFTAAHELGHFMLHSNMPLAREMPGQEVKWYEYSEHQADQFAAELLMPRSHMRSTDSEYRVAKRHEVSFAAASRRLKYLRKRGLI